MIFHTFNNISPQFSINLSATTPLSIKKRDCLRRICTKMDEFKSIKIYANLGTEFTAEDLLNICSPFGYVVRVQKIVKNGLTHGVVTYSNADDAFGAMMKLCGRPDFFVGYLYQEGARETYENKRPESPSEHQCLPQDEFSDMPPPTLPSLLDTLNPPAHSQVPDVCVFPLHMQEVRQGLRQGQHTEKAIKSTKVCSKSPVYYRISDTDRDRAASQLRICSKHTEM
ncbi:uncharacterized protein LOC122997247 isoform X3 [Thunnus albacares]|uniref:uncharacterized protein LOC122997247 isoform X3 n=1 Tax=Thunnus albacares TaxID=8236 RepID=UPI001CF6B8A2|nr:uncharacterized protein LOC122997247 isoform X3 [Thunnus albacares]